MARECGVHSHCSVSLKMKAVQVCHSHCWGGWPRPLLESAGWPLPLFTLSDNERGHLSLLYPFFLYLLFATEVATPIARECVLAIRIAREGGHAHC